MSIAGRLGPAHRGVVQYCGHEHVQGVGWPESTRPVVEPPGVTPLGGRSLLGDGGAVAVTMRAVVRAAQLSPRYFYESFASREELLFAVHDRSKTNSCNAFKT